MFSWCVLKHGVPESVWFCIGDFPRYTFLVPTYLKYQVMCKSPQYVQFIIAEHALKGRQNNENLFGVLHLGRSQT